MHNYIITIFLILFSVTNMVTSTNLTTYSRTSQYVKEDLEVAVHDASLQIDESQYSKGLLVIDPTKAQNALVQSLQQNAGLQPTDYQIIDFKIFDNSNTPTFPVNYTLNGTNFTETIESPTVVVAIRVQSSKYFHVFKVEPVTRVASYSYKVKNASPNTALPVVNGTPSSQGFLWALPFTSNIIEPYTPQQVDPATSQITWHRGIDIASDGVFGKPVVAVKDGTVTFTGVVSGYGNTVEITHNGGVISRYSSLNTIGVTTGQAVTQGQTIGTVGSSGESLIPHLHFETELNGVYVDPLSFYDKQP